MARKRLCEIDGCSRPHMAKGLCAPHYYRERTYGDPFDGIENRPVRLCTIEGCDNKHLARGLCEKHYASLYRRAPTGAT